jgi:hypothetical protein
MRFVKININIYQRRAPLTHEFDRFIYFNLMNKGEIIITIENYHYLGISFFYDIKIKNNKEIVYLNNVELDKDYESIGEFFSSRLIDENIYVDLVKENESFIFKYKLKHKYNKIFELIESIYGEDDTNLIFKNFIKIENNILYFNLIGHQVAGSYTHEYEVIQVYLKILNKKLNKSCNFIKRTVGGFGYDNYIFSIKLK